MIIGRIMLGAVIIAAVVFLIFQILMNADKEHGISLGYKEGIILIIGGLGMSAVWVHTTQWMMSEMKIAWLLLYVYFLGCTLMDIMTCQVYDVMQFIGLGAAVYLIMRERTPTAVGVSVLIFTILQAIIFIRLYGKADGMAFVIAALAQGALGYEIEMYFLHMILAYLLLSGVQICRGNVGGKGRLKKPVAFYPYITVGFLMVLVLGEQIKEILQY